MKNVRSVVCWAIAVAALGGTITVAAQSPSSPVTYWFDIAAGPLDEALARFRTITGTTVTLPPAATISGLATPGVSGMLTAEQALTRLVAGTGLRVRSIQADRYALEIAIAPERVVVTARAPYGAATTTTATKTLAVLRDVPQAITVITQAVIADQRMQSMADVVRYVPGVGMGQGEGNRDTPILRGNATTADFYVDGIRDDVQYFRDLYNVERVEALKGPNAMIFGRGGAGGIINRTTRQADWGTAREVSVTGGSYGNRRVTADLDQRISDRFAARVTSLYEDSDSYRRGVTVQRYGFNPTVAMSLSGQTVLKLGYEHFHDERTADRGVPSFGNKPLPTPVSAFFGDPQGSAARITVNSIDATVGRRVSSAVSLRNRTRVADYDKFYQNVYPSAAVNAAGTMATIAAYSNASGRRNVFNQTDLTIGTRTGTMPHSLLLGAELGHQSTGSFRQTGYFTALGPDVTSMPVPITAPTVSTPVVYRQSGTDADNHATGVVAAMYVQDEIALSRYFQTVVGLRYDRFDVTAVNRRTNATFRSTDHLISPRAGLVFKPVEDVSIYSSYSVTFLPRAGEQFSSLSISNHTLDPERFNNHEVGVKWDILKKVAFSSAVYRLDRTNVIVPDPNDANRSLLVKGQRTKGLEIGLTGTPTEHWSLMGGYSYQDGRITRTLSAAARQGAVVALVPTHSISLWNRYDVTQRVGVALGIIHSSDLFTSTDNTVTLPAFTRADAALFVSLSRSLRAQANVENLFDARYYAFANGNNNITPASPRALRLSLTTQF